MLRRSGIALGILICATAIVSVAAARQTATADMSISITSAPGTPAKVKGFRFRSWSASGMPGRTHLTIRFDSSCPMESAS